MFHVYDGDGDWQVKATLDEAMTYAQKTVDYYRNCCDPEWPDQVEQIAIYEAPADCEYPDEDGTLVVKTVMTDIRDPDPGSRCDFFCDYLLAKLVENID